MMKFRALNESSVSEDFDGDPEWATREAQEEEAYAIYNDSLRRQLNGNLDEAEELLHKLLQQDFILQAQRPGDKDSKEDKAPLFPPLNLKYLAYKNLASIASKKKNYHSSVDFYLKALDIDPSDVCTWYSAGKISLNLPNYPLAQLCFEEGLKCSPDHWLCLDKVITVTYVLNDYANCLYYISKAFEKEPTYTKGLVYKDEILKEDPNLISFCGGYFSFCNPSIHYLKYESSFRDDLIKEASELRKKGLSSSSLSTSSNVQLANQIKSFTWLSLGESLISTYNFVSSNSSNLSFSSQIDLSSYLNAVEKTGEKNLSSTTCSSDESSHTLQSSVTNLQYSNGVQQIDVHAKNLQVHQSSTEIDLSDIFNMKMASQGYSQVFQEDEQKILDTLMLNSSQEYKKSQRKRRLISEFNEFSGKRRSMRVRNPAIKRPQDNINYSELLQCCLPNKLIGDSSYDDQDKDSCSYSDCKNAGDHTYGQSAECIKADQKCMMTKEDLLTHAEKKDVLKFLANYQENDGLLKLLYHYILNLGIKSHMKWPGALIDVFCDAFIRIRNHITIPDLFSHEFETDYIKEIAYAILTFGEFKVDQWYTLSNLSRSPTSQGSKGHISDFVSSAGYNLAAGEHFHSDMEFLIHFSAREDILDKMWLDFTVRALWLKAKLHSVANEVDMAACFVARLLDLLRNESNSGLKIIVPNTFHLGVITVESVQQQLDSLQRCQSLEEVQRLFEHGDYRSVADLLICTFSSSHSTNKLSSDGSVPERHAQLILLQDSLLKLESYQECVRWTEVSVNEAIQQYMNASNMSARNDWTDTMCQLLRGLEKCSEIDRKFLSSPEDSKLVRLTQNLILIICLQVDSYEISLESSLTVLPWITLYRLISNEELNEMPNNSGKVLLNKIRRMPDVVVDTLITNRDVASQVPSSLLLLFTAHECLGRRSYCCASKGKLLLHCVDVFMEELRNGSNRSTAYREELEIALEQCFFCLYAHPNKRTKAKHLHEHNAQQITLTWERAIQVYEYFRPNILPEFDSYRTSTVSAELENLLKRISLLVPSEQDPTNWVDTFTAYVEGGTDKCPCSRKISEDQNIVIQDLYYLLGDYYFKNKEFSKAIRYYLLDICLNPDRQDSWAGMALSRSSQLDQKLNSYEVRNESTIWRKASSALRCFEHALQLNSSITSLWIEYGSLAYVLHSHASKQLKQNSFFDGPRDLLKVKKEEMLHLAEKCFTEANQTEYGAEPEEAWLHHYMLGKITQKQKKDPDVYLDHYEKSLRYLHEDGARYPHKIQYHNPPELSIEVLEVYYRIHASCLKFLTQHETSGIMLKKLEKINSCLTSVSSGPFANFQEKAKTMGSPLCGSEVEDNIVQCISSKQDTIQKNVGIIECDRKSLSLADILFVPNSDSVYATVKHDPVVEVKDALNSLLDSVSCIIETSGQNNTSESRLMETNVVKIDYAPHSGLLLDVKKISHPNQETFIEEIWNDEIVHGNPICSYQSTLSKNSDSKSIEKEMLSCPESSIHSKVMESSISEDVNLSNEKFSRSNNIVLSVGSDSVLENDVGFSSVQQLLTNLIDRVLCDVPNSEAASQFFEPEQHSGTLNYEVNTKTMYTSKDLTKVSENSVCEGETLAVPNSALCMYGATSEKTLCLLSPQAQRIKEVSKSELEQSKLIIEDLIQQCLNALRECLKRFIQHYKSLYRIAYYYCYSSKNKNLQWAREILLAATPAVKNYPSMPGLFAERKNANFFNGIWRAPSNEIDRPGSFGSHMYRSVYLLISVLSQKNDYNMLLSITQSLYRTPDLGKKYMRDVERISLTRQSYDFCLSILRDQMNSLLQEEPPPEESRLTCCLLEIYRTFQTLLKCGIYVDDTNELLEEEYRNYKLGEVDTYPSVLEQAITFCQLQLGKSYQSNCEAGRYVKQVASDEANSKLSSVSASFHTPDAWQREFAKSILLSASSFDTALKSDAPVLQDSLILIPVDSELTNLVPKLASSTSAIPTQLVQVEKPRAENLRACSMAFLPVTSNKISTSVSNTSLLSCQAYECYNILETLMQASGYQVISQTASNLDLDCHSHPQQHIPNKPNEVQSINKQHVVDAVRRRAWRKWATKASKQAQTFSSQKTENKDPKK